MTDRFARPATGDDCTLDARIDALETAIVDIRGEHGNNGKLGALKARVDTAEARRWWAVTALAGVVITLISASIAFGRWMSRVETDVEWLKQRRKPSLYLPADAGKDNSP